MGFSLTGTHVIFFIAATIVAGMVSGVFIAVTMDVTTSLSERGDRVQEQLDTDFAIVNDPNTIPTQASYYIFYMKNIGGKTLTTTNVTFQVFIDGDLIAIADYYFTSTTVQQEGMVSLYVKTVLVAGDHTLRVVGPRAVEDEFIFTT